MSTYRLYSDEKLQETLAFLGEEYLGETEQQLYRQLLLALCEGDITRIGAQGIAPTYPAILKQIVIAASVA